MQCKRAEDHVPNHALGIGLSVGRELAGGEGVEREGMTRAGGAFGVGGGRVLVTQVSKIVSPARTRLTGSVAVTWMGGKDRGTLCGAEFANIPLFFAFDWDCDGGGRPRRALGGTNAGREGVGVVEPGGRGNGGMRLVEAGGLAEVDDSAVVIPRARRSHSRRTKVASPLDGQSQRLSKCPSEWITDSTDRQYSYSESQVSRCGRRAHLPAAISSTRSPPCSPLAVYSSLPSSSHHRFMSVQTTWVVVRNLLQSRGRRFGTHFLDPLEERVAVRG